MVFLRKHLVAFMLAVFMTASAHASTLFSDDFEGTLSAWTGKAGGPHHGVIVADPLDSGNHVLNFTALNSAGDIFTSAAFSAGSGGTLYLSFDYLGICTSGNCGGFIGYSLGYPGSHTWLGGTGSGYPDLLPDTGAWNHITMAFMPGTSVHLMLEQFSGSTGPIGIAYFDNIALTTAPIPEPETWALMLLGLGAMGFAVRRRTKAA